MKTLWTYVKPNMWRITLGTSLKFIASLVELLIPLLLAQMIDVAVPRGERNFIYLLGFYMVLAGAVAAFGNIYANRMAATISGRITRVLRHDLFAKISHLSMAQLDQVTISSAISRLTTDTYHLNNFLNRTQRMGVRAPILLIGGLFMTLILDVRLTLVLVLALPFISLIIVVVTKKSVPLFAKQQEVLDRVVRVMQENISGVRIIKALSKTRYEQQRFDGVSSELADSANHAGRVAALSNPLTSLTLNLGLTAVVLAGGFLVNQGLSTTGTIIAFMNYFLLILQAMMGITRIFIMTSRGAASAKRVEEILLLPQDLVPVGQPGPENGEHHVVFEGVSFSYHKTTNNLEDISFQLKKGQTLGILGATGSGKSTLVSLLLRLYDPDKGRILLSGRDIKSLSPEQLRAHSSVVFQNDFLLADTIGNNIAYFRDIPEADIKKAMVIAQAETFINETKDGLLHQVAQKGRNLSGGQQQRLLIARALAGNPELLILDDSSSALDYRTDSQLRGALAREFHQVTKVIIAQRVSSIRHADLILVLDEGRAIGQGDHQHLMETCPEYREIAQAQMGAEIQLERGLSHV